MKKWIGWLMLGCLMWAHEDDPKKLDRQPCYRGPGFRKALNPKTALAFPSLNMQLYSWIPIPELQENADEGNDCWGYVSQSGREYAMMGLSNGTVFVDVTYPSNAQVVGFIAGPTSIWRDIKVFGTRAYAVSEGGSGIQVFDLSAIDQGIIRDKGIVLDGTVPATHNVAINEESGYLYRCGGSDNGLRIYDLNANPDRPSLVAVWPDRYVHDAQIVVMKSGPFAGRELAFCCAGLNGGWDMTGLTILDVTDKANLKVVTHYEYPQPAYSHQGWISEDQQTFYLNDELDERTYGIKTRTHVMDISNLTKPVQIGTFSSNTTAIDHNLYVHQGRIYEANYRSGLRVFDATDPHHPSEMAFFDTYPEDDRPNFNGIWSNYPYFPSQTLIGSDLERGLFVLKLDPQSGDLNGDLQVDQEDLTTMVTQWNDCATCSADLDQSGLLDARDLAQLLTEWNQN
ncbi:MAG: choice-of-anchor B family protein [Acidobacteria bacterium]|nr:choice-of-anchor B family protein [Acidobacteriota bacterium]